MAAEEDKKFNAVLGGFLVNDLRGRAGHLHCPESDVLAAYHERSLLPEEMNSWKEHIVGCARCQAVLSELEATDSIPLLTAEKEVEEILVTSAAQVAAGVRKERPAAPAAFPEKFRVTSISRGVRWQWLAPAGALAAGLLVWIAWHENKPPLSNTPEEIKTAKLEPPATPPSSAPREGLKSSDELARLSKDQGTPGGYATAKKLPEPEHSKQFEKSNSRAKVAVARPATVENPKRPEESDSFRDKERGTRQDGRELATAANRTQKEPAQDGKASAAGAVSESLEVQAQTANTQLQNQQSLQNQLSEQKISGPSPLNQTKPTKKAKSESAGLVSRAAAAPPPPTPPAAFDENVRASSAVVAGSLMHHLIPTAGKKALWRVGHMGMIEFSNDGGASWTRQTSNVSVDLTAGSAPSDKVCWIVGRAGTILLTTDAGAHWATFHSPLEEDLGGVRSTDALHATIWNLANTKTFETADGGLTWKPVPAQ